MALRPQVARHARALVHLEGHAFVVVVGQLAVDAQRMLAERQEPLLHRRHGDARARMGMQHRIGFRARFVDATVDHEPGLVDAQARGVLEDIALLVDLYERRGGDLVEHQAERVDQEMVLGAGHARGEMREDQVGPFVVRGQLVGGGEIDPHIPLFLAYTVTQAGAGLEDGAHGQLRRETFLG